MTRNRSLELWGVQWCSEIVQERSNPDAAHKLKKSESSKYMTLHPDMGLCWRSRGEGQR